MDDPELEKIRQNRMRELQQQQMQGMPDGDGGKAKADQMAKMEEMKNMILSQSLDQAARSRLNTIAVAKPDKAKMVEGLICQMYRQRQLPEKLSEQALIGLLEQVSSSTQKKTTVKFDRRRINLDSDDDDF